MRAAACCEWPWSVSSHVKAWIWGNQLGRLSGATGHRHRCWCGQFLNKGTHEEPLTVDGCGFAGSSDALLNSHFHNIYICGVIHRHMEFDILPYKTIGVFSVRYVFRAIFKGSGGSIQRGAKCEWSESCVGLLDLIFYLYLFWNLDLMSPQSSACVWTAVASQLLSSGRCGGLHWEWPLSTPPRPTPASLPTILSAETVA